MFFWPRIFSSQPGEKHPQVADWGFHEKASPLYPGRSLVNNQWREEKKWKGVVDGELWAGTDNQSGCPGDTNFSVQHPPPCFAPSKSFQSRQGRSVAQSDGCLFFCLAVQYGPSLWRLDKTWVGQKKKGPPSHCCAKCTFGWACCCLGWGVRIPRGFLSNVSAAGQRGDMVSGAWEWPAWDGFISAPLSCQN